MGAGWNELCLEYLSCPIWCQFMIVLISLGFDPSPLSPLSSSPAQSSRKTSPSTNLTNPNHIPNHKPISHPNTTKFPT